MTSRDWNWILTAVGVGAVIVYLINRKPVATAPAVPAPGSPQLPQSSNPLLQSMDQAVINLATGISEL